MSGAGIVVKLNHFGVGIVIPYLMGLKHAMDDAGGRLSAGSCMLTEDANSVS